MRTIENTSLERIASCGKIKSRGASAASNGRMGDRSMLSLIGIALIGIASLAHARMQARRMASQARCLAPVISRRRSRRSATVVSPMTPETRGAICRAAIASLASERDTRPLQACIILTDSDASMSGIV